MKSKGGKLFLEPGAKITITSAPITFLNVAKMRNAGETNFTLAATTTRGTRRELLMPISQMEYPIVFWGTVAANEKKDLLLTNKAKYIYTFLEALDAKIVGTNLWDRETNQFNNPIYDGYLGYVSPSVVETNADKLFSLWLDWRRANKPKIISD